MRQKYLTEAEVLKAIEDEPELPGEMTEELVKRITELCVVTNGKLNVTGARMLLRSVVRATKIGISKRIRKIALGSNATE